MGIVTAAVLKLHPLPTVQAMAWLAAPSPQAALQVLGLFQERCGGVVGLRECSTPRRCSWCWTTCPAAARRCPPRTPGMCWSSWPTTRRGRCCRSACTRCWPRGREDGLVADAVVATSGAQRQAIWERCGTALSEATARPASRMTTDCAVPVSALPQFIEQASAAVRCHRARRADRRWWRTSATATCTSSRFRPAGSGAARPRRAGLRIKHAVNEVCHALGGTFSAEHGVGQMLTSEMAHFKSPVELDLMRGIKALLDPQHLFNPGRLLPAASSFPSR
jgi:FAD/FMN-containing dehydrogenase